MIPMSSALREALKEHRTSCIHSAPHDLIDSTAIGALLSSRKRSDVHWRRHATNCICLVLLGIRSGTPMQFCLSKSGEPVKTAQTRLRHSDIETTLSTYMPAIPDSQPRAVKRVAGALFLDVPKLMEGEQDQATPNSSNSGG